MKQEIRGDGFTKRQMLGAPTGAIYVWCNGALNYPSSLARFLHRTDLKIVSPQWVLDCNWRGMEVSGVVLDHAIYDVNNFTSAQVGTIQALMTRIR